MLSIGPSPEMYLKSLFELSPADEPVSIAAVASHLGVTPVSASEMVHRLERGRLVVHRRYRGVRLTTGGRQHAIGVIRRHRLWECFLHGELGLPWEDVHDLACELEHAAGDEVTEALAQRLGHPLRCPHGNLIPDGQRHLAPDTTSALDSLAEGDQAVLVSVHPETNATLAYLAAHDFHPGRKFVVERIERTDRLYLLRCEAQTITVGPELAGRLNVHRATPAKGEG
jgi:DtxR family Mn-dependent transcriptional regulator